MFVRRPLRLLLALCLLSAASHALAERRALVIGNADYAERRLPNPINDADDMAAKLKSLGFAVTLAKNADKRALLDGLEAFRAQLRSDDDAVFYFAGHGAQLEGRNYLIPLNADIHRDKHLETEAVDLLRVLEALDPVQNGLKLAILDACRNNPYPGSGRAGTRGLAPVPKVPNQSLLWFAASPGEEADDGAGRNGLFTGRLLKVLDQPGLDVEHVFKQVAREVIAATRGKPKEQHPYPEGQTLVDFYFAGVAAVLVSTPLPAAAPVVSPVAVQSLAPPPPRPAPDYGIKMVDIPATEGDGFLMGSPDDEPGRWKDEGPQHKVRVAAFKLSETEVTQKQWRAVMGSDPPGLRFKGCDDCPVDSVSFNDIQAFLKKTGDAYRLPTEAEWEYACRAGQDTRYCGGDDVDAVAWYDGNSGGKTHPVKGKAKNAFGLYDMSGNVWEWTADCWYSNYQGAPTDGSAWTTGDCAPRVLRGGSWFLNGRFARSASRSANDPGRRYDGLIGFRLAPGPGASTGR